METTFLLIRHGNIDLANRVPGRLPGLHLSKHGRAQALRIAELLKSTPIAAIYSSPLDRTMETAMPLAQQLHLEIIRRESLIEIDFGAWTGKSFEELEHDFGWKQFHFFRNGCIIPDGELMVQVQSRMMAEIRRLHMAHSGQVVAIFSHNDPIKSVLAYFLGISLDLFLRISVDTGSISIVSVYEKYALVRGTNITGERPLVH